MKQELIKQANELYNQLEAARRMQDYDSAQAICGKLQHLNRQLHLIKIQIESEALGNIV